MHSQLWSYLDFNSKLHRTDRCMYSHRVKRQDGSAVQCKTSCTCTVPSCDEQRMTAEPVAHVKTRSWCTLSLTLTSFRKAYRQRDSRSIILFGRLTTSYSIEPISSRNVATNSEMAVQRID